MTLLPGAQASLDRALRELLDRGLDADAIAALGQVTIAERRRP